MAQGMFGIPTTPEQEEKDRDEAARRYALMDSNQRIAYESAKGADLMGRGIKQLGGGLLGVDTRSRGEQRAEHEKMAQDEIQALNLDPSDVNAYYPPVIRILGKHGLAEEAAALAEKYARLKAEVGRLDVQNKREARQLETDRARDRRAGQKIEIDAQKAQAIGGRAAQIITLIGRVQAEMANLPDDDPRMASLAARVRDLRDALEAELATKNFELRDAGDRLVVFNKATGETSAGPEKGAKPPTAKEAAKAADAEKKDQRMSQYIVANANELARALQGAYDMADAGAGTLAAGTKHVPNSDAWKLDRRLDQVRALVGFNQLAEMRKTSPTGGALGQVTEKELAFLQSVLGSLEVAQKPDELKRVLRNIAESASRAASDNGGSTPAIVERKGKDKPAQQANKPAAAPAAPAASAGEKIRVIRKADGKKGTILRSDFNPEKYEEIK